MEDGINYFYCSSGDAEEVREGFTRRPITRRWWFAFYSPGAIFVQLSRAPCSFNNDQMRLSVVSELYLRAIANSASEMHASGASLWDIREPSGIFISFRRKEATGNYKICNLIGHIHILLLFNFFCIFHSSRELSEVFENRKSNLFEIRSFGNI